MFNLSGSEIVFRAVGVAPEPVQLVARRVARPDTVRGSVSDAALQQLLKQSGVPGVSVAVIKDFKLRLRSPRVSPIPRQAHRSRPAPFFRPAQSANPLRP